MKNKKHFNFKTSLKFLATMLVMILSLANTSTFAQAGKANFSGTWAFNESKSTPSEGGFRMGASLMVITQDGNNMSVESTRKNRDGDDVKSTSKFTMDGKECSNPAGFGNSTRKSIVTWSADGKTLSFAHTMSFERDGQTNEFKSAEAWKINNTDKTIVIDMVFNGPNGEMKTTNIYDKK
jgi:hypothetical protein